MSQDELDFAALFEVLQGEYEKEKSQGRIDEVRQMGLEGILGPLGDLVRRNGSEQTLPEMVSDRGKLEDLMGRMLPRVKSPSLPGPELPAGSRAARVVSQLQELKAFLGKEAMRPGSASGESDWRIDLFTRLARLTKAIHDAGGDEQKLRRFEADEARQLANEVRSYARRHHPTLARPVWSRQQVPADSDFVFFAGPEATRDSLRRIAEPLGLRVSRPARPGTNLAEAHWNDLQAASLAVFDLSAEDPQVYYELGIALAQGSELLLVARQEARLHFDVDQTVQRYSAGNELRNVLEAGLDLCLYGLQGRGADGSSVQATLAHAERLAGSASADALLRVALQNLRTAASDAREFRSALKVFDGYLGPQGHVLLYPRWPGVYPNPLEPRCFVVMPFKLTGVYEAIRQGCRQARCEPVRGDHAEGQEIVRSIWEEIGRATHAVVDLTGFNPNVCLELGIADTLGRPTLLIGKQGTERELESRFPSLAKRRCHPYPEEIYREPARRAGLAQAVEGFLSRS